MSFLRGVARYRPPSVSARRLGGLWNRMDSASRSDSNESSLDYSRACPICFAENPPERVVFTQCGHIICNKCADIYSGQNCVICRAASGVIKLFEEEASGRLYCALIRDNSSLKKHLTQCIGQRDHHRAASKECEDRMRYYWSQTDDIKKKFDDLQKKHRDDCKEHESTLDQVLSQTAEEIRSLKEQLADSQRKHRSDYIEYECRILVAQSQASNVIRSLKNRLAECSCGGKPSVPVEEHQAMLDKHRAACEAYDASLKLERSQTAEEIRSLKELLIDLQRKHRSDYIDYEGRILAANSEAADKIESLKKRVSECSCGGKPSVPVEEHKAIVNCEELERKQSEKADEIRSLEKQLAECSCDDKPSVPLRKYEELLKQLRSVMDTLSDVYNEHGTRGHEETLHQIQQDEGGVVE